MFCKVLPWIPRVFSMFFLRSYCFFCELSSIETVTSVQSCPMTPLFTFETPVVYALCTRCVRFVYVLCTWSCLARFWFVSVLLHWTSGVSLVRLQVNTMVTTKEKNEPHIQLTVIGLFMPTTWWSTYHPPRELLMAGEFIYPPGGPSGTNQQFPTWQRGA